ncbi:MAG: hypothetical protein WBA43_01575 [Elainellaceae cyanobacterium]|jgi:hypothetical protein|uniref:hypothetical protein n=1 Tax=Leptolyngbya sp. CCY15150 TaxID=2767772 RepID=UPI00194E43B9|nr:hypothetical protein [Leptolyngbya sp. CCY15150]
MKPIRLSKHAHGYTLRRGFSIDEVQEAIRNSAWKSLGVNQFQCQYSVPFQQEWNGKLYSTKQIKPIFVERSAEIIVITVYTQYL